MRNWWRYGNASPASETAPMPLTVAIIGRANVGKSTLFNKLVGRRAALVHDTPGVTRDTREAQAEFAGLDLVLIDTAGIEPGEKDNLTARMAEHSRRTAEAADLCLFVIDGREGVTAADEIVAADLRKSGKPVIMVANKCESRSAEAIAQEAWSLGFGEPLTISAEHNLGFDELYEALAPHAEKKQDSEALDAAEKSVRLAIVGRPNVGKSSLFNRLIGEERALTGPEAGITRDAIAVPWQVEGRRFLLHDTAGLRKKARAAGNTLEEMSVGSTLTAVRFSDCVIVVLDATQAFEKQDLTIADLIAREGRAVVFAVNKWDLVANKAGAITRWRRTADEALPQIAGSPLIAVSATSGEGLERLLPAVIEADRAWNKRVPTAALNRFLEEALARHAPPAVSGRRVRIRYMTQVKARPPTFALFGNQLGALPESYLRYLTGGLREGFDLKGTPIRLMLRTSKNPYAD
jgi:GTPase